MSDNLNKLIEQLQKLQAQGNEETTFTIFDYGAGVGSLFNELDDDFIWYDDEHNVVRMEVYQDD